MIVSTTSSRHPETSTLRPRAIMVTNFDSTEQKRAWRKLLAEAFQDEQNSPLAQSFISDIRQVDAFIIDAYDTVGKEVIEVNNYSFKKIKEAMIMKNYREKTSGVEFVQLLKNSFKIGEKYTREYIKKELMKLLMMLIDML